MKLSIAQLEEIPDGDGGVLKPDPKTLQLPEKILQFGTGVLLRGLPDFFIDEANRQGLFMGRVVIVKSTSGGDLSAFGRQDGLYTLCIRGIEHGHRVSENRISSAISRVLSAADEWGSVLELARQDNIRIVISNTTEIGIQPVEEDIHANPPASFPGKLLSFLYTRYKAGGPGMVIIPTELISDNGRKLKEIVLHLAQYNKLEGNFLSWLDGHNYFCSSLVDRIVPGKPEGPALENIQKYLGYEDDLLLVCESYHLWAIEGSRELLSGILSFAGADSGVIIASNIDTYKELKLRLLNGTHSLCCGLAFLSGFDTVRDAMEDEGFGDFIKDLMMNEIAHAIPLTLPEGEARRFGEKVLDRFRNPYLEHRWINITLQYSLKMKARVLPVLLRHYAVKGTAPACISKGFAGYLLFMRPVRKEGSKFVGESRGIHYTITDDMADALAGCWASGEPGLAVKQALQLESLWETDLTLLKGFEIAVYEALIEFMEKGGL